MSYLCVPDSSIHELLFCRNISHCQAFKEGLRSTKKTLKIKGGSVQADVVDKKVPLDPAERAIK